MLSTLHPINRLLVRTVVCHSRRTILLAYPTPPFWNSRDEVFIMRHAARNYLLLACVLSLVAFSHHGAHAQSGRRGSAGSVAAKPTFLPGARGGPSFERGPRTQGHSVARQWNEALLAAIRRDTPRPTVHARNLFHVSAAMYDAWAAHDPDAVGYFHVESAPGRSNRLKQEAAISYAAYRVLSHRFAESPGHATSQQQFDDLMRRLRHNPRNTNTRGYSPAAVGNRVARAIIEYGSSDGANEANGYVDVTGYQPVNDPLLVEALPLAPLQDINRWQPLIVPGAADPQRFLTPHWGGVASFALPTPNGAGLPLDPGPPPILGGGGHETVIADVIHLLQASASLDPADGQRINISPSVVGNNTLGTQDGTGHDVNPATGKPYPDNYVLAGDWGRVLAEFWADGPLSSTPPGHWNEIANEVSDHPKLEKKFGGNGPSLSDLEWDVKLYFALNAALHDSAIATWGAKASYDYGRPITMIREMAARGQSSDDTLSNYDPLGLPLVQGLVEVITGESSSSGERHADLNGYVGEIAVFAWRGHPEDPENEYAGAGWILGVDWLPYQQRDFVTPPFAGYTSGHSGFSRASAEVLTAFTGDPYFPGGVGQFLSVPLGEGFGLGFEYGPVEPVLLEWATYADAADEAGLSRIYGGIHPALDDYPGRILGAACGQAAFVHALDLFEGRSGENP